MVSNKMRGDHLVPKGAGFLLVSRLFISIGKLSGEKVRKLYVSLSVCFLQQLVCVSGRKRRKNTSWHPMVLSHAIFFKTKQKTVVFNHANPANRLQIACWHFTWYASHHLHLCISWMRILMRPVIILLKVQSYCSATFGIRCSLICIYFAEYVCLWHMTMAIQQEQATNSS